VAELVRDALRNMGRIVAASRIALLGASYREDVGDTQIQQDLSEALKDADCMILAVRHDAYMDLDPEQMVGILSDAKIQHYIELGCEVKGLGRGHIKRIKDCVQSIHIFLLKPVSKKS